MIVLATMINYDAQGNKHVQEFDLALEEHEIQPTHRRIAQEHPESFLNFVWGDSERPNFICGMRYGQELDEQRLARHEITWEQYSEKWY